MASHDDQLWNEVSDLLGDRPGWSIQDSPTPGVEPNWAFVSRGKVVVSVFVEGGSLHFYEEKSDLEREFGTVAELTTWVRANRPNVLTEASDEARQPLLRWR